MALAKEEAQVLIWNRTAECMPPEEKRMLQLRMIFAVCPEVQRGGERVA